MDHSGNLDGSDGGVLRWLANPGPEIEIRREVDWLRFFFLILIDWLGFFCLVGGERE